MELTLDQALQQAVAAHREGKLQDAERLYRAILQAQPNNPDANHNLGVLAVAVGKASEALPLFKLALDANPKIEQFWLSYIDTLIKSEQKAEAIRVLADARRSGFTAAELDALDEKIHQAGLRNNEEIPRELQASEKTKKVSSKKKSKKTNAREQPSRNELNRLIQCYRAGRLDDSEALAISMTTKFPAHPLAWKVLGAVLQQGGRHNEALAAMRKAVKLEPTDAATFNNIGVLLQGWGRLDESEASYRRAIAVKRDFAEAHNNLGLVLADRGNLNASEASYRRAISINPEYSDAFFNLGITLSKLGSFNEAEASYRQAISLRPDFANYHYNLGNMLRILNRLDESEASYRKAIELQPDYAEAHNNLGTALQYLGKLDTAEIHLRCAVTLKPDYAEAHRNLTLMKTFLERDEHFFQMQALHLNPTVSDDSRCHICFALAKACDDLEDFSTAFKYYTEGNALRREQLGYDKNKDFAMFKAIKTGHSVIAPKALRPQQAISELVPIFIVGMPRSGTTLVEQIISAHPLVTGAGELPFAWQFGGQLALGQVAADSETLTRFGSQYLEKLEQHSLGKSFVTDKMPQNFRLLGLIAAALPAAKIIHVKRDPSAVCWANYVQYFVNEDLDYCNALEDIAKYYSLYEDLMDFWNRSFGHRIYDLYYEQMTENQEEETRRMIDYLGLPWAASCLAPQNNLGAVKTASFEQVRRRVYQGSSERWRRYEPFLNGVLDNLEKARR